VVFRLTRAKRHEREDLLAAAREAPLPCPHLLTLEDGPIGTPPRGFVRDHSYSLIGQGERAFAAAREAFRRWEQFHLGWVHVASPVPEVIPGELVAVEAHTAYLWSMNISCIVEVVDSPTRFGFMYSTTAFHVEEGQERFVIEFDPKSESVFYLIEALSRPRNLLVRIGYPFSRAIQHRFARDSHARMKNCLLDR
jgi:uncharacterized protein (UPF0548 family)